MISKIDKRKRRAKKTRAKIKQLEAHRLCIHRSSNHIYAQIIAPDNQTVAATSSLDPEVKSILDDKTKGKIDVAKAVGQQIAKKAKKAKKTNKERFQSLCKGSVRDFTPKVFWVLCKLGVVIYPVDPLRGA